jgi:hypothetical protein
MAHTHCADDGNAYYLEQLCMVGFCGALGVVQIMLYYLPQGSELKVLDLILAPKFHIAVLIAGYVLTSLAVIRGVIVWIKAGRIPTIHGHDHACSHKHTHEHEHSDAHDHSWAPWRYIVLLLPILLFLVGMPWPAKAVADDPAEAGVLDVNFMDLQKIASTADERSYWQGKFVRVKGEFDRGSTDRTFSLVRWKMTCCRADAYRLNVRIESPEPVAFEKLQDRWVNVTGQISFAMPPGRDEHVTILKMRHSQDVKQCAPDPRQVLN